MNFKELFGKFQGKRVLVVGDVMIDSYLRGKVNRISPEAPVPIVSLTKEEDRLGGAANVALNLVALGAKPVICSVVGKDKHAKVLKDLLIQANISADGLILSESRITTVKTRVIGNNQQLLRIDSEQTNLIDAVESKMLADKIRDLVKTGIDGIIFEDYNKGVLTPELIEEVINIANENSIVTAVDPKKDNFLAFRNVTLFKPNLKELKEGLGLDFNFSNEKEKFLTAVSSLENELKNEISLVTLSEHGVFIKQADTIHFAKAHSRVIADVSGAGDTVISVATLCLLVGLPLHLIAEISNIAGGLVCETSGVVPIDKIELLNETERLLNPTY